MNPLTEAEASAVWAVLVEHAGASDDPRDEESFVQLQSSGRFEEWLIGGSLGFGGKFRRGRVWVGPDCRERWYVDCYREDETPARLAAIEATNAALATLREKAKA